MRIIAVLLLWATVSGAAWAQKPEAPTVFRDHFISALKAADPSIKIEITDPLGFKIGHESPPGSFVTLDNSYQRYLADLSQRDTIFAQMIKQSLEVLNPPPEYSDAKQRLIAMPRPKDYLRGLPNTTDADVLITRPFVGDLMLVLMIDGDGRLETVAGQRLAKLGIDADAAFKLAAENLPRRLGKLHEEKVDAVLYTNAESGIAVATLGLPDACTTSPASQRFVFVAAKEYFFSAAAGDKAGVAQLQKAARGMIAARESLSAVLLECRAGAWRTVPLN